MKKIIHFMIIFAFLATSNSLSAFESVKPDNKIEYNNSELRLASTNFSENSESTSKEQIVKVKKKGKRSALKKHRPQGDNSVSGVFIFLTIIFTVLSIIIFLVLNWVIGLLLAIPAVLFLILSVVTRSKPETTEKSNSKPETTEKSNIGTYREVLYLKNGSIIKGIIIEQIPNVSYKIETGDGSVFIYKFEEVEKITKEKTK
jgi:hypothetical protein